MISVYSTFASDTLLKDGSKTVLNGGPLYFIEEVFKTSGVSYESHYGKSASVEIKISRGTEIGKITKKPEYLEINPLDSADIVLISTIFDEWKLDNAASLKGKIILDLQGYVRNPDIFGGKKNLELQDQVLKNIFCLKATKQELGYLGESQVEDQKKRVLIVTDGGNEIVVFESGKKSYFKVNKTENFKDTIGAGDTFLANVALGLDSKSEVDETIRVAIDKTLDFLKSKTE